MDAVRIVLAGDLAALRRLVQDDGDARHRRYTPGGLTLLMVASASGTLDCVRFLLESGEEPDARSTAGGETALMLAAARQRPDVIRVLLEEGADIDARDDSGATALHHVFAGTGRSRDLEQTVRLLVQSGASLDLTDVPGPRPSDLARRRKWALRIPWLDIELDGWRTVRRDRVVKLLEDGARGQRPGE